MSNSEEYEKMGDSEQRSPPPVQLDESKTESKSIKLNINLGNQNAARAFAYSPWGPFPPNYPAQYQHQQPAQFPVQWPYAPYTLQQQQYMQYHQAAAKIQSQYRGMHQRKEEKKKERKKKRPDVLKGALSVQVKKARDLKVVTCCRRMDPVATVSVGKLVQKTAVVDKGHDNPSWGSHPPLFFNMDAKDALVKIDIDHNGFFCNTPLATTDIEINHIYEVLDQKDKAQWINMKSPEGKQQGQVKVLARYIPSCRVLVQGAKELVDVQWVGKQDPYVVLKYKGALPAGEYGERRTKVSRDGHKTPTWNEHFDIPILSDVHITPPWMIRKFEKLGRRYDRDRDDGGADDTENLPGLDQPVPKRNKEEKKQKRKSVVPTGGEYFVAQIMNENTTIDDYIAYAKIDLVDIVKRSAGTKKPVSVQLYKGKFERGDKTRAGKLFISVSEGD